MKVIGEFNLETIEAKFFFNDPCIYFRGEGREQLAFVFSSARKAISSAKKLSEVLKKPYNIMVEVQVLATNEKNQESKSLTVETIIGDKDMKKAGNIRKVAKEQLESGKSQSEVLNSLIQTYVGMGKNEEYANSRARVVLISVLKKMDRKVDDGIKIAKKEVAKKVAKAEKKPEAEKTEPAPEPEGDAETEQEESQAEEVTE